MEYLGVSYLKKTIFQHSSIPIKIYQAKKVITKFI